MMKPIEISVISKKFDNSVHRTWKCGLVHRSDSELILVGRFESEVDHPHLGKIIAETVSFEYFWFDRWYNIFRFHGPDGSIRNHYCNFAMPPRYSGGVLSYIDLDIDIIVWPDNSYKILDLDEFQQNSRTFNYPKEIISRSEDVLTELIAMIDDKRLP